MAEFFIDKDGKYLGAFEGKTGMVPDGAVEVPEAPKDGRMIWTQGQWIEPVELQEIFIAKKIEEQVGKEVSLEEVINAIWTFLRGDKTEFVRIDLIMQKAEEDHQK